MKVCYKAYCVKRQENYYVVSTNAVEIRIWFLTDDIIRIRAGFDGDWDEASYSLVMTAWNSRTDHFLGRYRKKVTAADSVLTFVDDRGQAVYAGDGAVGTYAKAVIKGSHLRVEVEMDPFRICVYDREGTLIHADIPDLGYREDSNHRRKHSSRIEEEDRFYGFGEKTGHLNKAEECMVLSPGDAMGYNAEKTDSLYKHIPFYIRLGGTSRKAVGYFYDNTAECSFNMGREKRNYWHRYSTFTTDSGDIDLFLIAGPSIREVIERYTDLTGKSVMLQKAALGYLGSSMYYAELPSDCDDAILRFIDTTRKEEIPVDGFQLSSGYCAVETSEGLKRCTFTWNHKRFKDPAAWFRAMKEKGILVSANIKPGMLLVHPLLDEMKQKDLFIKTSDDAAGEEGNGVSNIDGYGVGTWWGGKGLFVDFTNEKARNVWKEYITDNLLRYGCESVWNDNCEYDSMVDQDSKVSFEGKGGTIGALRSVMSNIMCQLSNEAIQEYDPDIRPFSVCRSGHAGIQRYAQVWAGDNLTSWTTLKYNIATILGMGLSGVANEGCDVGGFYGPAPEPELFVRWVQNGIFQPRFSIHSTNTDNTVTEPWMYSDMTPYIRDAIKFRYRLAPYLYSLMERAHETGLPVMEAMVLAFQNDPALDEDGINFMFGDHMMVCNVVEKSARSRRVYFPRTADPDEKFYDFYTRQEYTPGQTIEMPVDIRSVPIFIHSGAIIPMSHDLLMNLSNGKTKELDILMAPDVDSEFILYEDDGKTNDYLEGKYLKTRISVGAGMRTAVNFSCEGSYISSVETIHLDMIHREKAPFYVLLDGREIPHYLFRGDYETAGKGWYYSQRLKSVQIRYHNPGKNHQVLVSFDQFDLIGM